MAMQIKRSHVKRVAGLLVTAVLTIVVVPLAGQFFISLAEEQGWYHNPGAKLNTVIAFFAAIASSPSFHWAGGAIIGFAVGVWLDAILKRRDEVAPKQTVTLSLSLEDQQFRLGIRTFILSNLDELGQWFGRTIGLSIVDYRDREKDEFLGYLFERSLLTFYNNKRNIEELFANNNQPDVEISQREIKAYLLSYRDAYQLLRQFRQYAKVTTNAENAFNKWLDADARTLHSFRDLKSFAQAATLQSVDDAIFIARTGAFARLPEPL